VVKQVKKVETEKALKTFLFKNELLTIDTLKWQWKHTHTPTALQP